MFDLEQAIGKWRKQMLAAGIKSPVPLEELGNHLREEINQSAKSGMNEQAAFNSAIQKIGQPDLLKSEFKQISGLYDFLPGHRNLNITFIGRILGFIWLAFYGGIFLKSGVSSWFNQLDFKSLLIGSIFLIGLIGGILLMLSLKCGRGIIRMNALIFIFMCIIQVCFITEYSTTLGIFAAFCIISIWLLHLPAANHRKMTK